MRPNWTTLSQTERDASYNNNLAVANSAELIEQRNTASALFRQAHADHLDVAYAAKERTRFDLYPAQDAAAPCLVFIHGGYWQRNRREDFAVFAQGAKSLGWSVAMPGYSLAPDVTLTEIVAEIDQALTWLAANGPKYAMAAGPIIVAGWSAGAHLAVLALDHPAVAAGVAISGVFDLAPIRETYLNEKLQLSDGEIKRFSPLHSPPVDKPLVIAYGSRERWPLVEDSRDLHALRAQAHRAGALVPIPGADHFTILHQMRVPDSALMAQMMHAHQ